MTMTSQVCEIYKPTQIKDIKIAFGKNKQDLVDGIVKEALEAIGLDKIVVEKHINIKVYSFVDKTKGGVLFGQIDHEVTQDRYGLNVLKEGTLVSVIINEDLLQWRFTALLIKTIIHEIVHLKIIPTALDNFIYEDPAHCPKFWIELGLALKKFKNVDWYAELQLQEYIHERIASEGSNIDY